jgi:hypothetical protein
LRHWFVSISSRERRWSVLPLLLRGHRIDANNADGTA